MTFPKKTLIEAAARLFHKKEQEAAEDMHTVLCRKQTPPKRKGKELHILWGWALRRWGQTWPATESRILAESQPVLRTPKVTPPTKWKSVLDLPKSFDTQTPCVVVWQDSEHCSDQGVEVSTLGEVAEGKYQRDRVIDAYWISLADALDPKAQSGWVTISDLPPRPEGTDEDDDWDERGVVAYFEDGYPRFEESCLYQVRDGDYEPTARWLSVMDAPPMVAWNTAPTEEEDED